MNLKATAQNTKDFGTAAQSQIADVISTQENVLTALDTLRSTLSSAVYDEIQKVIDAIDAENYGDAKTTAQGAKDALLVIMDEYLPL